MPAFLVASDAGEEHKVADPGPPTMPKDGELMVIRHMQVSPRPPPAVAADDEANAGEQVSVLMHRTLLIEPEEKLTLMSNPVALLQMS